MKTINLKSEQIDFSDALKSVCPFCGHDKFKPTKEKSFIQCTKCWRVVYVGALKTEPFIK